MPFFKIEIVSIAKAELYTTIHTRTMCGCIVSNLIVSCYAFNNQRIKRSCCCLIIHSIKNCATLWAKVYFFAHIVIHMSSFEIRVLTVYCVFYINTFHTLSKLCNLFWFKFWPFFKDLSPCSSYRCKIWASCFISCF